MFGEGLEVRQEGTSRRWIMKVLEAVLSFDFVLRILGKYTTGLNWVMTQIGGLAFIEDCRDEGGSAVKSCVSMLVAQSCPTLCDPMDCSPPGSSVRGIF